MLNKRVFALFASEGKDPSSIRSENSHLSSQRSPHCALGRCDPTNVITKRRKQSNSEPPVAAASHGTSASQKCLQAPGDLSNDDCCCAHTCNASKGTRPPYMSPSSQNQFAVIPPAASPGWRTVREVQEELDRRYAEAKCTACSGQGHRCLSSVGVDAQPTQCFSGERRMRRSVAKLETPRTSGAKLSLSQMLFAGAD